MKILVATAALVVLAAARPEQYKETEDFKYSRSSTDEGTKAGYYGAQRGNMGGNYERAHNMDSLAQNQMGTLIRQTDGELGDISDAKTGNVYTSANSRGRYGAGKFDLSNLEGRNFQEGSSFGNSNSYSGQSLHSSDSSHQAAYSRSSGYRNSQEHGYGLRTNDFDQNRASSNLRESTHATGNNGYGKYDQSATKSGQHQNRYQNSYVRSDTRQSSNSGYQGSELYDGSNARIRFINTEPARIVIRPGETVVVPIATQTYDANHGLATFDENAINTGAINGQNHSGKRYESAYSYNKKWEKHSDSNSDVVPVPLAYPTSNPNSELYDDTQLLHASNNHFQTSNLESQNSHHAQHNKAYSGYNSDVKSATSQSQYQSGSNSNSHYKDSNSYGEALTDNSKIGSEYTKPKSYQSSYSYHKSWERQGDPYVITPNGVNDEASQRLTSENHGYSANQYGSQSQQRYSDRCLVECDTPRQHRKVRSYNTPQIHEYIEQQQNEEDFGQQTQTGWANIEELKPQGGDASQQAQTNWNSGTGKLQDFGQQSQSQLGNLGQDREKKRGKLEDFGQQKEEDLGQQTQTGWEDLTQQAQSNWGHGSENLQDFGQQTQNQLENSKWEKIEDLGQQTQTDFGGEIWDKTQNKHDLESSSTSPLSQNPWDPIETMDQQVQNQNSWNSQTEKEHKLNHISEATYVEHQSNYLNLNSYNMNPRTSHNEANYAGNNEEQFNIDSTLMGHSHHTNEEYESRWRTLAQTHKDQNEGDQFIVSGKEKHTDKSENGDIDQHNGWNFIHQNQAEDETQNTQNSWGQSDLFNMHTQNNNNKEQKFSDNTQQHGTDSGHVTNWSHHYFGTGSDSTQQSAIDSDSQSGHRLHSIWDKINSFEHSSSNDRERNGSSDNFASEQSNSQSSHTNSQHQSSWTDMHNYYGSYSGGYHSWSLVPSTETTPHDTTTITTKTTNSDEDLNLEKVLGTEEVGRGDIGPEKPALSSVTTSTTEKLLETFVPKSNDKQYKTPEEIEALSSSKVTEKTITTDSQKDLLYTSNDAESGLNVLGINQQTWLAEHSQLENTPKTIKEEQGEVDALDSNIHSQSTALNKVSENKDHKVYHLVSSQQSGGYGLDTEQHTETEQKNIDQQFVNVGDNGQHDEDLEQQSQNGWENINDFGQAQSMWNPQENLQQSDTQQFEQFGRSNDGQQQTEDFYNQNYKLRNNDEQVVSHKYQHLQNTPISQGKVEEKDLGHEEVEVLSPIEPTTEKSGFWKSVGTKFSNAKDKVSSWFSRS